MLRIPTSMLRASWTRSFSSGLVRLNAPKLACVAGTVLNLKVRKNGDEPVALADTEYPEWLWTILDKAKTEADLKEQDPMKWRRKQNGKRNTARIKNNNFLSQM